MLKQQLAAPVDRALRTSQGRAEEDDDGEDDEEEGTRDDEATTKGSARDGDTCSEACPTDARTASIQTGRAPEGTRGPISAR